MPACAACGQEEFDVVDGLYYCTSCQTQSQDIRVETVDQEMIFSSTRQQLIRPRATERKEKEAADWGRSWTTAEAFQMIMKQQVQAIIELGADPRLDEIVYKYWVKYLSRMKVAFCEKRDDNPKVDMLFAPYCRDKQGGGRLDKPIIHMPKKKNFITAAKLRKMKRKEALSQKVGAQGFYEGDNPFSSEDEDDASDEGIEEESSFTLLQKNNRFGRLKMNRTLCFIMLGLSFTNPHIRPHDLTRWIRDGKVPYKICTNSLPEDMKFLWCDSHVFSTVTTKLSADEISRDVSKLAWLLQIPDLPEVSLHILASRYIEELNLPGELHGMVKALLDSLPPSLYYKPYPAYSPCTRLKIPHLPEYDVFAMVYIVMTLKLLFGLDGIMERKLSHYADQRRAKIQTDPPLFVWDEWVSYMEAKIATQKAKEMSTSVEDLRHIQDVGAWMERNKEEIKTEGRVSQKLARRKLRLERTRDNLTRSFNILHNNLQRDCARQSSQSPREYYQDDSVDETSEEVNTTKVSGTQQIRFPRTQAATDSTHLSHSEQCHSGNILEKDFTICSLKYLDDVCNSRLTDLTTSSSISRESQGGSSSEQYSSQDSSSTGLNYACATGNDEDFEFSGIVGERETASECDLAEPLVGKPCKNYIIYEYIHTLDKRSRHTEIRRAHSSFEWLIKVCARLVGVKWNHLLKIFQMMEMVYMKSNFEYATRQHRIGLAHRFFKQ